MMWLKALNLAEPAHIAGLIYFTPFLAMIIAARVLGEHTGTWLISGAALIVIGNLISNTPAPMRRLIRKSPSPKPGRR